MKKYFALGFALAIILIGCASFTYDRYGVKLGDTIENSTLLHHDKSAKDLPLDRCREVNGEFQCVAMFADEFYQMKTGYEQCQDRLVLCEKSCD